MPPDAARIAAVARHLVVQAAGRSCTHPVACQMCDSEAPATAFCETCIRFACFSCAEPHGRMTMFKAHIVRSMADAAAAAPDTTAFRRAMHCAEHPDQALSMFCVTCLTAACMPCCIAKHSGHKVEDAAVASEGLRARMRAAIASLSSAGAKSGAAEAALAARLDGARRARDGTAAAIDAAHSRLSRVLLEQCNALKASAGELLARQEVALAAQGQRVAGVAHVIKTASDIATRGTPSEVCVTHAPVLRALDAAASQEWSPTCEGPVTLREAEPDALRAWLQQHCALVPHSEALEAAAASDADAAAVAAAIAAATEAAAGERNNSPSCGVPAGSSNSSGEAGLNDGGGGDGGDAVGGGGGGGGGGADSRELRGRSRARFVHVLRVPWRVLLCFVLICR